MTWSIVAHDPETGAFGVAVTTRFFAVGALCPHARSGVGALATQALINPLFGPLGLELLAAEVEPQEIVRRLVSADEGREHRQLHLIDRRGRIAQHSGRNCIGWCGARAGQGYSVAGNMLAGERVVDDTAAAYEANARLPSRSACWPPSTPARRRAGTSAASSRRHCASLRRRSTRASISGSTIIRSRSSSSAVSTR